MSLPPIVFCPTDVPLKAAPINPHWVRVGNPEARNVVLSRSADGTASTILWDCSAGEFVWHYDIDETIYFLEGSAVIGDAGTPPRRFVAGDVLFLPKGSVANWHVESYVKKVAFCRRVQPKVIGQALRAASFAKRLLTGRGAAAPAMSLGG
ncbi:MAG: cupin domain-containing protein [Methylobacterium sp.]|uniref:cupin domain-containing protein n=1 Tax=Methylobacterium sp. TaxID=409 RepID=UPI002584B227|nr:cupin domain-containing protein [Methylobacterium sp.]MBY0296570.1 cupin domain-containing protein [Methylobacterium sp.]